MKRLLLILALFCPQAYAVSLISQASAACFTGSCTATTSAIDTTGATLLVVPLVRYGNSPISVTISDSKGNSWNNTGISGNYYSQDFNTRVTFWYAYDHGGSPLSVGSGHTLSVTSDYVAFTFVAFSGTDTTSAVLDQHNAGNGNGATIACGSITPSGDNYLVVAQFASNAFGQTGIDSGLTVISGTNVAWVQQGTAAAINPTWTTSASNTNVAADVSFKATASSPTLGPRGAQVASLGPGPKLKGLH